MSKSSSQVSRLKEVQFVLWAVLALNLLVALAKLSYGMISHSIGMQADGFHSLFDGVSNVIGLVGLWLASRPPDENHPYGHKKFETLAAAGIGGMLLGSGLYLAWRAYQAFGNGSPPRVTAISFGVMIGTMVINVGVSAWERQQGKRLQSEILLADSYHTASDFLTSFSVLIGLLAIRLGYPIFDPLVALFVAIIIAWTAMTIFKEVIRSLADEVRLDPQAVRTTVMTIPGILDCHDIRTRGLSNHIFVDLSIHVPATMPITTAHHLSHTVEEAIKSQFQTVEDVVVHIEPDGHQPEALP